jgi:hypothetical protein
MKRLALTYLFLLSISFSGTGQEQKDVPQATLAMISQVNQGNSYITFPFEIGNMEELWFEANIIPNFMIRKNKSSRLMGVLTPQVILRMYREESFPVRTPSYIPQITMYYLIGNRKQVENLTVFARFAHHSNGQTGSFYLENGEVNHLSGDFSTNFFEAGAIFTNYNKRLNAHQFFSSSLEVHPESWSAEELRGRYANIRWHHAFSIFKLPAGSTGNKEKKANISLKARISWLFGAIDDWSPASIDRMVVDVIFFYHPGFLEEIGLFVQFYHGLDYYNIYFDEHRYMIRFGIMTEKLRF